MGKCECHLTATTKKERKALIIALALNLLMFVVGLTSGILAQSTALIADSFDMLTDSLVYSLGLLAIGRKVNFKVAIARFSGTLLLFLGVGILFEVTRRALYGSFPESTVMITVAFLSFIVNTIVFKLLTRFRNSGVHLRATWIFTRADIIANVGVIVMTQRFLLNLRS